MNPICRENPLDTQDSFRYLDADEKQCLINSMNPHLGVRLKNYDYDICRRRCGELGD